jgi:hypothetical protein
VSIWRWEPQIGDEVETLADRKAIKWIGYNKLQAVI